MTSSFLDVTSDILGEVLNELGFGGNNTEVERQNILKFIQDDISEADYEEGSLFDLDLNFASPQVGYISESSSDVTGTPIRERRTTRFPSSLSNLQVDQDICRRKCDHELEAQSLIDEARVLLGRVYKTFDEIDEKARCFRTPSADSDNTCSIQDNNLGSGSDENSKPCSSDGSGSSRPTGTDSGMNSRKASTETVILPDPSLRQVLCPAPGKGLFRHDPVTMHQIYKEEWKRRPTPDEQKRLSLRWKVREYMLRRDIPKRHPTGGPVQHTKDWSPRPYLD